MGNKFNPRCHIGEEHGIYTIVDVLDEKDKYGHYVYKCVCNLCGYEILTNYGKVAGEKSIIKSCHHIRFSGHHVPHGRIWKNKRIGGIFNNMVSRCYNKQDKDYRWYGGKNIGIYDKWLEGPKEFEVWSINNGYDDTMTIDRIDAECDYCPTNCQWIPLKENSRKAGNVNWITVEEHTLTGRQWSEKLGIGVNTINRTVKKYGVEKTKELIAAMLKDPPYKKDIEMHQSWFSVYNIQV